MNESRRGQVIRSAAEVYEEFFVPALFDEWTSRVADAAALRRGDRVLDVACGTGVLARAAAERVGAEGAVVGLDVNEGMLEVARRREPRVDWRRGRAEALPFEDAAFDAVVSQFGLMFFEDREAALREMARVIRPGGRLAVAVWAPLAETPGYAAAVRLLDRLFGADVADALRAPFELGDRTRLRSLLERAALGEAEIRTEIGTARFPSIRAWMTTDVKGWTLADRLDDRQFALLLDEAERELAAFAAPDGSVSFASPAHLIRFVTR